MRRIKCGGGDGGDPVRSPPGRRSYCRPHGLTICVRSWRCRACRCSRRCGVISGAGTPLLSLASPATAELRASFLRSKKQWAFLIIRLRTIWPEILEQCFFDAQSVDSMAIDNNVEARRTSGPADTPQHRNREAADGDHNTESREKRPSIEDAHRDECPGRCTFLKGFVHEVLVLTSAESIIYPNTTL